MPLVLAYHPVIDTFDTYDELEKRVEALATDGYLRRRTISDVTGDPVTEYETAADWEGPGNIMRSDE